MKNEKATLNELLDGKRHTEMLKESKNPVMCKLDIEVLIYGGDSETGYCFEGKLEKDIDGFTIHTSKLPTLSEVFKQFVIILEEAAKMQFYGYSTSDLKN